LPRCPLVPNPKLQSRRCRLQTLAAPPVGSRRPPPLRRQEDPREHHMPVRSTPVSLVRVPVPRFAPRALTTVRRRLSSAPPRGLPPPSPARPPECLGLTPCVASFAPVQISLKTVPPSRRSSQHAGVARAPPLTGGLPVAGAPPPRCSRSPAVRSGLGGPDCI
jgi:hypothetical protein